MENEPIFKKIKISNKQIFDSYLNKFQPKLSEYTFTNLFCWGLPKGHAFATYEDHLVVSNLDCDEHPSFFQPIGSDPAGVIKDIYSLFPVACFQRIDKDVAEKLTNEFKVDEARDMYDYVYKLTDLIELGGTKYANKRNFVNRFKDYNPEIKIIDKSILCKCLKLQEKWCDMKNCRLSKDTFHEDVALKKALIHFEELALFGIAILVKDDVVGFAIGEPLNDYTYVEHFEKANPEYNGSYQFLLNEFAKAVPKEYDYLNREQDLGIEGLRKAKLSYHPDMLMPKFKISQLS